MKSPRVAAILVTALLTASVTACSNDDDADVEPMNTQPFAFLVGEWSIEVSPTTSNCDGERFFPAETWVVGNTLASVRVTPLPDPSEPPEPVPATASPTDESGEPTDEATDPANDEGGSTEDAEMPPSYSGLLGETLAWSASGEEQRVVEGGCLERRTTLLELQFTPEAEATGSRAVFVAYTGGADCPVDCRMTFDVEGALEAE